MESVMFTSLWAEIKNLHCTLIYRRGSPVVKSPYRLAPFRNVRIVKQPQRASYTEKVVLFDQVTHHGEHQCFLLRRKDGFDEKCVLTITGNWKQVDNKEPLAPTPELMTVIEDQLHGCGIELHGDYEVSRSNTSLGARRTWWQRCPLSKEEETQAKTSGGVEEIYHGMKKSPPLILLDVQYIRVQHRRVKVATIQTLDDRMLRSMCYGILELREARTGGNVESPVFYGRSLAESPSYCVRQKIVQETTERDCSKD
ncbi:hypothetical protein Tco_0117625 [Tanacetum coccineum]